MPYKVTKAVLERMYAKRKHILDTASRIFSQRGYNGTTMKDLIDGAGISVGSFYFYFKNKEQVFETIYTEMTNMLFNILKKALEDKEAGDAEVFSKAVALFLKAVQDNRELARIMMIEAVGLNPRFEQKRAEVTRMFVDYAAQHFAKLTKYQGFSSGDVEVFAMAFIGTVYNVIMEWLQREDSKDLTDYAYALVKYNLNALRVEFRDDEVKRYIGETLSKDSIDQRGM